MRKTIPFAVIAVLLEELEVSADDDGRVLAVGDRPATVATEIPIERGA